MYGEATQSPHRLALQSTGLSAAAGTAGKTVLTLQADTAAAVKSVTLSPESRELSPEAISQVTCLLTLKKQFGCKSGGDEIASTEKRRTPITAY
jgi:hypothetical protein